VTIDELKAACHVANEHGGYVILRLPAPNGNGYTRRLGRTCGPRGEILCGNAEGQTVRFLADAILRYLEKHNVND
jgi:hypothetical protein